MVYLGISSTTSAPFTRAWHDSREVASRPQALSSRSSSFSSAGSSEPKPSRRITWQVVQAQDFSQACSISMPCASRALQIVSPAGASNAAPAGHSAGCGRTVSLGIQARDAPALQRPAHAGVHAARGEILRGAAELVGRELEGAGVLAVEGPFQRPGLFLDRGALVGGEQVPVLAQPGPRRVDEALRFHAVLVERARAH